MNLNSKREYRVLLVENGNDTSIYQSLKNILADDGAEVNYAMQEIIDSILDLKVGESLYFQPNRDDRNSKAIIFRLT